MKQVISIRNLASALMIMGSMAATQAVNADDDRSYIVTVTNITKGQVVTPPIVIAHNRSYSLFSLGQPASEELATLAEEGDTAPLVASLAGVSAVKAVATGAGPIMPGQSLEISISSEKKARYVSIAGMLASTNDAFFAIRGAKLPKKHAARMTAPAYDAGSEDNNENCAFIPGPPCGIHGVRDVANAEGYVYIHPGVHGISDLVPAIHDWNNGVVAVTIRRVGDDD